MVTRPQPGLDRDLDIYRTVAHHHGGTLGVWTRVLTPGVVREGDAVEALELRRR
jgi:MOSC domain-containing protein YiiM